MSLIRERRLKVGATQAELAALAGVVQPTISNVENGLRASGPVLRVIELALADLEAQTENGGPEGPPHMNQTTIPAVAFAGTRQEEPANV